MVSNIFGLTFLASWKRTQVDVNQKELIELLLSPLVVESVDF